MPATTSRTVSQGSLLAWFMCAIAAVFYGYEFFLRVTPTVMVPYLMKYYAITATQIGVLSAFYYYAYTPLQLFVGTLMDHYNVRTLLTLAVLACALGSYFFGFGDTLTIAKTGRLLVGFGSAFAFVGVMKLAADWLPGKYFALISGIATTLGMLGAISGEVILTHLIRSVGHHHAMAMATWIAIGLTVLVWLVIRDRYPNNHPAPLHQDIAALWTKLLHVGLNKEIWVNGVIGALLFMPTTIFAVLWGVPYFQQVHHMTAHHAANNVSLVFLGWAVGSPIMGWLSGWLKSRRSLLMVGSLTAAIIFSIIIYVPLPSNLWMQAGLFSFGVASSVEILVFAVAYDLIKAELSGTAVALTNMLVMLGGVVQPVTGYILDKTWDGKIVNHVHWYSEHSYQYGLSMLPVGLLACFILSFMLRETYSEK